MNRCSRSDASATGCSASWRRFRVPSFAFVNGAAMGGGLEVALHCTYRTVSPAAPALALPEVFLGLIPGWGGTTLLPRIVGMDNAVTVIVQNPLTFNTMLKPKQAAALGVADVMLDGADFVEQSLAWAASVVDGRAHRDSTGDERRRGRPRRSHARPESSPPEPRTFRLRRNVPSTCWPGRWQPIADGFAAEDQALADLTLSPELAASLYAFDLVQKRAKRPVGVPDVEPAAVSFVGLVGAGLMARQLAVLIAERLGVPVHLVDIDDDAVTNAREALTARPRGASDEAKACAPSSPDGCSSRSPSAPTARRWPTPTSSSRRSSKTSPSSGRCSPTSKSVVRDDCVLATNTSSLPVSAMADGLRAPRTGRRSALLQPGRCDAAGRGGTRASSLMTVRSPPRSPSPSS